MFRHTLASLPGSRLARSLLLGAALSAALAAPALANPFETTLANGMKLVALGLLLGALAAMALTRFLASLLYGIEPLDAPTFGLAALVLLLAGAAASYLPARRATAVSAMEALRHE